MGKHEEELVRPELLAHRLQPQRQRLLSHQVLPEAEHLLCGATLTEMETDTDTEEGTAEAHALNPPKPLNGLAHVINALCCPSQLRAHACRKHAHIAPVPSSLKPAGAPSIAKTAAAMFAAFKAGRKSSMGEKGRVRTHLDPLV